MVSHHRVLESILGKASRVDHSGLPEIALRGKTSTHSMEKVYLVLSAVRDLYFDRTMAMNSSFSFFSWIEVFLVSVTLSYASLKS